jgi:hypothetical protein
LCEPFVAERLRGGGFMKKLHLAAALLAASISIPTFTLAQNVQDKTEPQNPRDVTPASPASQGATDSLKNQSGASAQSKESATADQAKHHAKHRKLVHPK